MRVIFNKTEDFLSEARAFAQREKIDGRVCRLTYKYVTDPQGMFTSVSLVASFVDGDDLLCLEDRLCSALSAMIGDAMDKKQSGELRRRVAHQLEEMGFEIRGGMVVT